MSVSAGQDSTEQSRRPYPKLALLQRQETSGAPLTSAQPRFAPCPSMLLKQVCLQQLSVWNVVCFQIDFTYTTFWQGLRSDNANEGGSSDDDKGLHVEDGKVLIVDEVCEVRVVMGAGVRCTVLAWRGGEGETTIQAECESSLKSEESVGALD